MATTSRNTKRQPTWAKARHALMLSGDATGAPQAASLLVKDVESQAAKVKAAQKRLADERARLDELVACSVSSQPGSVNWYDHAGVLGGRGTREKLLKAAGLSAVSLHRVMERYREGRKPTR